MDVPKLIGRHGWHGRVVAVTAPLPTRSRRVPTVAWPCVEAARAIAGAHGLTDLAVADTPLLAEAEATLGVLSGHPASERAEAALVAARSAADVVVPHGVAHGGWVPWNLAVAPGELVGWDWEQDGKRGVVEKRGAGRVG